jgi:hypothetical protein
MGKPKSKSKRLKRLERQINKTSNTQAEKMQRLNSRMNTLLNTKTR